jgi:hypothetical protein
MAVHRMERIREIPWLRIGAESAAIVVSILFAFSLDAWWEQRRNSDAEQVLLESLQNEISENVTELEELSSRHLRLVEDLEEIRAATLGKIGSSVELDAETLSSLASWTTSDLATGTVEGLLASGELQLLSSPELRSTLAAWPADVADAQEDEILAQQFIEFTLTPSLLGKNVIEIAYLSRGTGRSNLGLQRLVGTVMVDVTPELIELTTVRIRHEQLAVGSLQLLQQQAKETLDMLAAELNER